MPNLPLSCLFKSCFLLFLVLLDCHLSVEISIATGSPVPIPDELRIYVALSCALDKCLSSDLSKCKPFALSGIRLKKICTKCIKNLSKKYGGLRDRSVCKKGNKLSVLNLNLNFQIIPPNFNGCLKVFACLYLV